MTATHTHRTGKYAEAYRLGSSVRLGEIEPAADPKALGQGYRDGLKGAPYRIPKKGAGAASRNNLHATKYRHKMAKTHVKAWVLKPDPEPKLTPKQRAKVLGFLAIKAP